MNEITGIATIPASKGIGSARIFSKFDSISNRNSTNQTTRRPIPITNNGPETPSTVEAWEACLSSESPLQQNKTATAAYPIAQTELDSMSSENWCACANPNGYANQMAMTAKEPARNPRSRS